MHAGWGLDWVWPFLLGFPPDKVAFLDDVCVVHPKKELQDPWKVSMYSVLKRPHGEEYEQYARYVFLMTCHSNQKQVDHITAFACK